ncbi:MAG: hypothetical protein ACR2MM_08540 [Flavobacteriaceae bacterium]
MPKTYLEFENSINFDSPSKEWPEALQAMWWDSKGNWQKSHDLAEDINSNLGNWIHAYLHRKDGDQWNAGYWYQRAGRAFPVKTLEEECKELVLSILNEQP